MNPKMPPGLFQSYIRPNTQNKEYSIYFFANEYAKTQQGASAPGRQFTAPVSL
jgi:hypothetical protein